VTWLARKAARRNRSRANSSTPLSTASTAEGDDRPPPIANPPRRNLARLSLAAILVFAWLAFLLCMAFGV
jgi:hypothetical protein